MQNNYQRIERPLATDSSLNKLIQTLPNYRIAQSTKKLSSQTASQRFWLEANKNNKVLIKFDSNKSLPNKNQPKSNVQMPKFGNDIIKKTQQETESHFEYEPQKIDYFHGTLENVAQTMNSKVTFQRNIMQHQQPYSFFVSVGAKHTSQKILDPNLTEKGDLFSLKQDHIRPATPLETMTMFEKLDIDKNLKKQMAQKPQIVKRPHTVSTINKLDINGLISQEKQLIAKQEQIKVLRKDIQSAYHQSKRIPTSHSNSNAQSNRPQSSQLQQKRIPSSREEVMQKLKEKNKKIIAELALEDLNLDIKEDLGDNEEVYQHIGEHINFYEQKVLNRVTSAFSLMGKRPISGSQVGPDQFFQNFSKYTVFNSEDLPYEDLFDRNERTFNATFAKFGDLGYYSAFQRIGSYQQYSSKFKLSHLVEICTLLKTSTHVDKNKFEIPIQLQILDENRPFNKTIKSSLNQEYSEEEYNREPISLSIFAESFQDYENLTQQEIADKEFHLILRQMAGQTYDPEVLGKQYQRHFNFEDLPEKKQQLMHISMIRYNQYVYSDRIKPEEIAKYQKEWIQKAFALIPSHLQNEDVQKEICIEIFEDFKIAMKKAMMNYILLNPQERKRLHIELLMRPVLTSNQRISREGGYNKNLFSSWRTYVQDMRNFTKNGFPCINQINSAALDWFQNFQEFRLMEFKGIKQMSVLGHTFSLIDFLQIQNNYRRNVNALFRNVWYRGLLTIIKRWRFLKRRDSMYKTFTFTGYRDDEYLNLSAFKQQEKKNEEKLYFLQYLKNLEKDLKNYKISNTQLYYCLMKEYIERDIESDFDFYDDSGFNDLIDLNKRDLPGEYKNLWKTFSKEEKNKIYQTVQSLIQIQLRQIIEETLKEFEQFILQYSTLKQHVRIVDQSMDRQNFEDEISQIMDEAPSDLINRSQISRKNSVSFKQNNRRPSSSNRSFVEKKDHKPKFYHDVDEGKTLIQRAGKDEEFQFHQPEFLRFNKDFYPAIQITMIYEDGALKYKEEENELKDMAKVLFNQVVNSLNCMFYPRLCKVKVDEKYEPIQHPKSVQTSKIKHAFHFLDENAEIMDEFNQFYKQFCSYVQIVEKEPKKQTETFFQKQKQQQPKEEEDLARKIIQVCNVNEDKFKSMLSNIQRLLVLHLKESWVSFKVFNQFVPFIEKTADKEIAVILKKKQNISNEEFRSYNDVLKKFLNLLCKVPDNINFPLFQVNCTQVKKELSKQIECYRNLLVQSFEEGIQLGLRQITEKYQKIAQTIRKPLNTANDVEEMERFLSDLNQEKIQLKLKASANFQKSNYLIKQDVILSEIMVNLCRETFQWPQKLEQELQFQEEKHLLERSKLEKTLKELRKHFEDKIDIYQDDIQDLQNYTQYFRYKEYVHEIEKIEKEIEEGKQIMEDILDQEQKLFGYTSNFDRFNEINSQLQPYSKLWKNMFQFLELRKKWLHGPIQDLDSAEVESLVSENIKVTNKLKITFEKLPNPLLLVKEFRNDVETMRENIEIIEILSRPGLKERHWQKIASCLKPVPQEAENSSKIEVSLEKQSLSNLIARGIREESIKQEIEEVSEGASKEFTLENAIEKMEKEWENLNFVVINWKNRNIKIIQGQSIEEAQILLDDHCIKAQTIRNNPNIKFMEERAENWEKLMVYVQRVLEVWVKVQQLYLYLEPIFSFEDILRTLSHEAKKFDFVKSTWNRMIDSIQKDPHILHINNIPNLLQDLQKSLSSIEEIQKGLETYLESKRLIFPRFFFLSNDDLINILAETRDPLLVQPHMKKCFEGISELIFNSNQDIIGMQSSEKEEIQFLERIVPRNYKSFVEQWLLKVEEQMKQSLSKVIEDTLLDILNNPDRKTDWVKRFPGQSILCITQTVWTQQIERKLKQSGLSGLKEYSVEISRSLQDIVALVRGQLTTLESLTLGALIVIEVHNVDVVRQLIYDGVKDASSFEWISQLRYYWQEELAKVNVSMITTTMKYGYEYLGNTSRLVITPLTDRCYRTLMSALQLNLGGAPEGPAGTGKTESVKDLAKALAMQCVVFNCSEGLNIHSMAKFFKGLIAAGAWSCFDEFNRIDLEVLSVIASQILQIQQAKAQAKTVIHFDDTELNLQSTCNVFITMNPGYAGRSELPDNLKALFRPVAMMVPDYALIAEISLYSFGFTDARSQARKIVSVYKLCSEQLSSQDHYDYGMRAVKAVLTTASQLKRKYPVEKEEYLVLRSISDVNLPKFLVQDVLLFQGIINDLFPGVKMPNPDYALLTEAITNTIHSMKLQNVTNFRKKILQLHEVINTRHGLMIVGQPFSGKTCCYRVLAGAYGQAQKLGSKIEVPTQYFVLNPKSVSINNLYGFSDPISKEWTEGILSDVYRACATNTSTDRKFIVFDGPVDADWIENMNTVLDDNKKLCLMSGETISMTNSMSLIFEVADLKQASPATVSRCGMVYMQPDQLGWMPLVQCWLQRLQLLQFDESLIQHIEELFDAMVNECLTYVKLRCVEYQKVPESCQVVHLTRLLENQLDSTGLLKTQKPEDINKIDILFIFSLMWTIGSTIDDSSRKHFDQLLRKLLKEPQKCETKKNKLFKFDKNIYLPEVNKANLCYDFFVDSEFKWKLWRDIAEDPNLMQIPKDTQFHQIVIATPENLRIQSLMDQAIAKEQPFLIIGPTGIGKTVIVNKKLKSLPEDKTLLILVSFSAQTSTQKTQEIIDSKLDRRKKGVYGPKLGTKCCIFVDDLNMPTPDKYGAQPPIELLRQFLDHRGWYGSDRKMMEIIDSTLIGCMGPPGGGRTAVTLRFLRHFNVIGSVENSDIQLNKIFNKMFEWQAQQVDLSQNHLKVYSLCVEASVEMYQKIQENLKPTPAKSHYMFNQRDLSRVMTGMVQLSKDKIKDDSSKIIRLWIHEISCVFFDRLNFESDQIWFLNQLLVSVRQNVKEDIKNIMKTHYANQDVNNLSLINSIKFGELLGPLDGDRQYDEMIEHSKLSEKAEYFLQDYNSNTRRPMNLVLFEFAVNQLIKICRILRMPQGNALLIGLGGSGRQSMTQLACHIRDMESFQVEVTKSYDVSQWREDIQGLMKKVGVEGKETAFVVTDNQLNKNLIIEDINSLLNTGDIPNIFSPEDFVPLQDGLRINAKRENKLEIIENGNPRKLYDYFIDSVKKRLHIVLVQSPVGESLRNRTRMFPNLINCTNIIWYKQWPDEALEAVASKMVQEIGLDIQLTTKVVEMCKLLHNSSLKISEEYLKREGRYNYITPSSYLELLGNLRILYQTSRQKLQVDQQTYENGIKKLIATAEQVSRMEQELIEKKPILIEMNKQIQQFSADITQRQEQMQPKVDFAKEQEAEVAEKVKEAQLIKEECEKDLSKAKPKLKQAEDALNTLDPSDINNIKAMLKPPDTVRLVMEAVCIMCNVPALSVPSAENPKVKVLSYWEASKKFMSERNFLQKLIDYDKDNISADTMKKIRDNYISNTVNFNPKRVEKASSAAKGLCEWILALDEYEKVLRVVKPKQQKYNESNEQVKKLTINLKKTQDELSILKNEMKKLQDECDKCKREQQKYEAEILDCEKKLDRASSLMVGLGGEQERWKELAIHFSQKLQFLVGDIVLSTGTISYLGPFSLTYRQKEIKQWSELAAKLNILYSENYSLEQTLGDPMQIRNWTLNSLPSDSFSIQNGIIVYRSRRWAMMIDPQSQANRWIKSNEKDNKLMATKQSDTNFMRILENCITFGQSLVIENVKSDLDSVLDPILNKQTFRSAGVLSIKLGDGIIEYNKDFRLFLTSKMSNPHFSPETSTKITIVNFTITQEGLEDQLLELCISKEEPEDQELRSKLIIQGYENQQTMSNIEKQILSVLNNAENILEDEEGVLTLQRSRTKAQEITEKQLTAKETEQRIEQSRLNYRGIATHSALLFFVVMDIGQLDNMYQYSLNWFINLYLESFGNVQKTKSIKDRVENINNYFTYSIYKNVCRSLFEKDKLVFSFLLLIRILTFQNKLDLQELTYFQQPIISISQEKLKDTRNPCKDVIPMTTWGKILYLQSQIARFKQLSQSFIENPQIWSQLYLDQVAYNAKFPTPFFNLTQIQRLCLLKTFRPDQVVQAVIHFIQSELTQKFTNPPTFNLVQSYLDSDCSLPLIFILPGTDPISLLLTFAEQKQRDLRAISLGQGQGILAERAIDEAQKSGSWVILQNCHLAPSWMGKLERICEEMIVNKEKLHPHFRLWLTSYPTKDFPTQVLQNSIKMTNEPPKGLKSNLLVSYSGDLISDNSFFEGNTKGLEFKKMIFGLCFFHAVIQERRTYGPLGWNIFYDFNQSDLRISISQLNLFTNKQKESEIPFKALHYLIGECNYGGRVTDDRDRRILNALMKEYLGPQILVPGYKIPDINNFQWPQSQGYDDFIQMIGQLPLICPPSIYGFHENGNLTKDIKETEDLCNSLLCVTGGRTASDNEDSQGEKKLKEICQDILSKFPKKFDLELVQTKYQIVYENSFNTVLQQEILRYNGLIQVISQSLKDIDLALKGLVALSAQLENVCHSLQQGVVPQFWMKFSYPSLKPLGSYITDFINRLKYYHQWVDNAEPVIHWISGYFFTQTFLTATLQNYARKYVLPIDSLAFEFMFYDEPKDVIEEYTLPTISDGSLMYGLFLESCRWDYEKQLLAESQPKILYTKAPIIWLKPAKITENQPASAHKIYKCPVYKTSERRGVLSTTGHSTNFIMSIDLPTDLEESHWVKRGVALLCQLND